jgi:hypothetical protein
VKFIEIELDGTAVRAQLNEDKAPRTAQALWDALPFEGRAVHAQTSGDMFRMLDETPIPELPLESPEAYQHPGEVVYYPPIREIAFCLGEARFRGHTGYLALTPLAEIEGDWSDWAKKADALQFTGARPIKFRKAADQQTPFRHPPAPKGRKIEVELGRVRARATLLEEWAPKTTAAFANLLPLAGKATNTVWSGQITRFWGPVGERGEIGLDIAEPENGKVLHWPGYIYYFPEYRGIRMCYGEGTMSGPWSAATLTPLAKFDPGWEDLRQKALSMLTEGEQSMSFMLVD